MKTDVEYSVITSDAIKNFDCSLNLIVCALHIKLVKGAYGTTWLSSLSALDIGKL